MMDEMCIVTDDNDMPIGKASKKTLGKIRTRLRPEFQRADT